MIKKTYRLQLASPAFLGDADQKGTWRTPPLKALIREWWRIAVAPQVAYEVGALKTQEKGLFGTAADDGSDGNQRSKIRLALSNWRAGSCKQWEPGEARVTHPEVKDRNTGKERPVGAELYLGYGPLVFQQGTQLNNGAALQAKEENTLKLAHAEEHDEALTLALTLAHWFGTIGGRSRNGWGSLGWQALAGAPALPVLSKAALEHTGCTRPLARCLDLDWPHAIGTDAKGALVWRSSRPHMAVVGRVPGTEHFRNVLRHKVETVPGLLALRVDESLFFANATVVEDRIGDELRLDPALRQVLLICSAVNQIDATALEVLTELERSLATRGIVLMLAEVKGPVMDRLRSTALGQRLDGRIFLSVHDAFTYAQPSAPPS